MWMCYLQIIIYLFIIYLFIYLFIYERPRATLLTNPALGLF